MGLRTWTSYTQKERNLNRLCIFKNLIFLIFLLQFQKIECDEAVASLGTLTLFS
jgi:hypothetical protein